MAKQRIVNTQFWRDSYILALRPAERLLFLWVITNPATDLCGAYEAAMPTIEFETGLKSKQILESFEKFQGDGKILYREGWVVVRNFARHQNGTSTNVRRGAERSLSRCPDWVKDTVSKGMDRVRYQTLPEPEPEPEPELKSVEACTASEIPPAAATTRKATRLPETFLLTGKMREYAAKRRPGVDVVEETEKFCNHWRSKPGRDGTKLDWEATWRNWILNAKTLALNGGGSTGGRDVRGPSGGVKYDWQVAIENCDLCDDKGNEIEPGESGKRLACKHGRK